MCLPSGEARAAFIREKGLFRKMGAHVYFYSRIMPAEPELVSIHDNVVIATNTRLLTHDRFDWVLEGMGRAAAKHRGCIEVMENVFVGSDVTICPGCRIGPNAFVAAGAVVTKDVLPGTVWGGVPARQIGSFRELVERRSLETDEKYDFEEVRNLWDEFIGGREI